MSESENLSGGKMTYLDGHIQNSGSRTVTAATVQVVFDNDEAMPPQIVTVPLALIRMTQPYIDTEQVGADPLKPGDDRAFRLIFESVRRTGTSRCPPSASSAPTFVDRPLTPAGPPERGAHCVCA